MDIVMTSRAMPATASTLRNALILASLIAACSVHAEIKTLAVEDNNLSYDYVEGGYFQQDFDGNFDVDGLGVRLASELDEHLFVRGEFALFDGDVANALDIDGFQLGGGLGFHSPLKEQLDLVITGDLIYADYDVENSGGDDEFGFRVTGGVRYEMDGKVDLTGGLFLEDIFENELGVFGQGLFAVSEEFQVGAGVRLSTDIDELNLLVRYNF
jgi:hypothetical protein